MIHADGRGDAARRDDGEHGDREHRQALRRYLVGKQQLARELAQREQADSRQQAGLRRPARLSAPFQHMGHCRRFKRALIRGRRRPARLADATGLAGQRYPMAWWKAQASATIVPQRRAGRLPAEFTAGLVA